MAKPIEVLLTEDVLKLGSMGDIVSVKPGYARNFLLPYGKAIVASSAAKRQIEVLQERARKREVEQEGQALALKKQIEGLTIRVEAKVSHDSVLFGSVGVRDIVAGMKAKGFTIDPKQVHLHENFKNLGRYKVVLGLFKNVDVEIGLEVVNADPDGPGLDETLAAATASAEDNV